MKTEKELLALLKQLKTDERIAKYPYADVWVNAPLALEQVAMGTRINTIESILNIPLSSFPLKKKKAGWLEDYDQENGNYQNKCCLCGLLFYGNKHRVVCKQCDSDKSKITEEKLQELLFNETRANKEAWLKMDEERMKVKELEGKEWLINKIDELEYAYGHTNRINHFRGILLELADYIFDHL